MIMQLPQGFKIAAIEKICTGGKYLGKLDKAGPQPFNSSHQCFRRKRSYTQPTCPFADQQKNSQENPEDGVNPGRVVES